MRALVLSGGGSRGAFQVGVLKRLAQENNNWYKVFCGVSVGAINTAWLAQYTTPESVNGLLNLWSGITDNKVKKHWFPFSYIHGLWKTGIYNSKPLSILVNSNLSIDRLKSSGNKLRIGAVSTKTLEYKLFTENDNFIKEAVLASSAFPGLLPAVNINNELYIDGGVKSITPLKAAISCPEVNEIDIILANRIPESKNKHQPSNAIEVSLIALESLVDEILINDIKLALIYNKIKLLGISGFENKRYINIRIFQPQQIELPGQSMQFDHNSIMQMISLGYEAADSKLNSYKEENYETKTITS